MMLIDMLAMLFIAACRCCHYYHKILYADVSERYAMICYAMRYAIILRK